MYDYLVVGAGLAGAVFAQQAKEKGKSVLVIDKRDHVAGNCYTKEMDGIHVHMYGGHILHTNDEGLWNYINRFGKIRQYEHRVKARWGGRYFTLPINCATFVEIYGIKPDEVYEKITRHYPKSNHAQDLETWIINEVGVPLYEVLFRDYTRKQWGRHPRDLPASIIKRLPIRFNWDDRYFSDKYQGVPENGYTQLVANMLDGIEVELGIDYNFEDSDYRKYGKRRIYTGPIDEFFHWRLGELEYRSLRHEHIYAARDMLGCATVNYTSMEVPYTRILEHKHYGWLASHLPHTWYTYEYPESYRIGENEPMYPIRDKKNTELYNKYKAWADEEYETYFTGRLATYTYQDMFPTIAQSLKLAKDLL